MTPARARVLNTALNSARLSREEVEASLGEDWSDGEGHGLAREWNCFEGLVYTRIGGVGQEDSVGRPKGPTYLKGKGGEADVN